MNRLLAISAFIAAISLPISAAAFDPGDEVYAGLVCVDEDAALKVQRAAKTDMEAANRVLTQVVVANRCLPLPVPVRFEAIEMLSDQIDADGDRSQVWRLRISGGAQDFFSWFFPEASPSGLKV